MDNLYIVRQYRANMGANTMKYWRKLSHTEQDEIVTGALKENVDYTERVCLGVPASRLDRTVFYEQASFLKEAPLLRTYVQNPNNIGCHTFGESEPFFAGTQRIEREVLELLAVDLLGAAEGSCDGYIASGGTEANIQAAWIYRNYFMSVNSVDKSEIALLCSVDTHYSVVKAANILGIRLLQIGVDNASRLPDAANMMEVVSQAKGEGVSCFIVFCNMGTTMFGSVDDPDVYARVLRAAEVRYKIHADGAFGGFIYPVSTPDANILFSNPEVSSITLDAHKMLQAPYGTGIFLVRKGLMQYTFTKEASYVSGMDVTLSGSRGGVNAVAIWMILATYGPYGWLEKINTLLYRTDFLCVLLRNMGVHFYRHKGMNIVTIVADDVPVSLAKKYSLVPDTHNEHAAWYKIVVMDHVLMEHLQQFCDELGMIRGSL